MGKSTIAHRLAARLGCTRVVDEWHMGRALVEGALHLTNQAIEVPA